MQYFPIKKRFTSGGFSLVEVLVVSSVFLAVGLALNGGLVSSVRTREGAHESRQALMYAEEGIEGARNIRDAAYTNLVNGTYGLIQSGGSWTLSGASDTTGIFTRAITVSTQTTNSKKITSVITWNTGRGPKTTTLTSYLTDVARLVRQASLLTINTSSVSLQNSNRDVVGITLKNTGSQSIVLDKIMVTWTGSSRTIAAVRINAADVWTSGGVGTPSGAQSSGILLDMSNVTIASGITIPITYLRFSNSMSGRTIQIVFTMGDGSLATSSSFTP